MFDYSWALEFVGGPLDGRKDIATTVSTSLFRLPIAPSFSLVTDQGDVPTDMPTFREHRYRRGRMVKRWQDPGVQNEVVWEVWLYEGDF